jgi:hypothetical protein
LRAGNDASSQPEPGRHERPDLITVGWALLRTGSAAFGGLGPTLAGDVSDALA